MIPGRCPLCGGLVVGAARTTGAPESLAVHCNACGDLLFPPDALDRLSSATPALLRRLSGRIAAYRLEEPDGFVALRASDFVES